MTRTVTLTIEDEINVRFTGLDQETIRLCTETLSYHVPGFFHMPKYRLKRWDGKVRLFTPRGATYLHLLDDIFPIFEQRGINFVIDDQRRDHSAIKDALTIPDENYLREFNNPKTGEPIILRDYQLAAIYTAIDNGFGLFEMATGSGKTITCGTMAKIFAEHGNVIVIVPSIDLAVQTQHVFKSIGVPTGIWYGEVKDRQTVTISTWQSLQNYEELFEGVISCIVDECHQAKARVVQEILSGPARNVPFRFGVSGTLPKEDLYQQEIKAALGTIAYQVHTAYLQEIGVLAKTRAHQIIYQDTKNETYTTLVGYDDKGKLNKFDDWKKQIDFFYSLPDRVADLADMIMRITEEYGNTLVLVHYRPHGKILEAAIPGSVSVDGMDSGKKRFAEYEKFEKGDNGILIATMGIAGTGLDIPRIHNLFIIEPGQKFEKVLQALGRGLRKAEDKEVLNLFDVGSDHSIAGTHARKRLATYKEAKQDVTPIERAY